MHSMNSMKIHCGRILFFCEIYGFVAQCYGEKTISAYSIIVIQQPF